MKKTRNLFVLTGCKQDVQTALDHIKFKGITVLTDDNVTTQAIHEVFANNKSVVCTQCPPCNIFPIVIYVVNTNKSIYMGHCINIAMGDVAGQFESIADKLNCDIGDHKSNSSGLTDAPKASDCAYCRYLRNEASLPERIKANTREHVYNSSLK